MKTAWGDPPRNLEGAQSLARHVSQIIGPLEARQRARRAVDQIRYDAVLADFLGRIATLAMAGRSWLAVPFGNDPLARAGVGKCLPIIRDGMIGAKLLERKAWSPGRVTRVRATPRLRAMAHWHGFTLSTSVPPEPATILRLGDEPMPQSVGDQDMIVRRLNGFLGMHSLGWDDGTISPETNLQRIFKRDWSSGGRLHGGVLQALSKEERATLYFDGEPVVELDFRAMQPCILFGLKRLPLTCDPYGVDGFDVDRDTGKLVFHRLVNRKGTAKRVCPLNFDPTFQSLFVDRGSFGRFVKGMEQQLEPVSDCFGKDAWRTLQREESELLLSILSECMDRGIPAYPIHDSLIVKASDRETAKSIMLNAFKERYGVEAMVG